MNLAWWEKEALLKALEKHNGNKSRAAFYLEKSVRTIRLWCKSAWLEDSDFPYYRPTLKEFNDSKTEHRLFPTNKERIKYLDNPNSYYRESTRIRNG